MKKSLYCVLILTILLSAVSAFAAETKMKPSAAELKKMSTFLSNFTELSFWNFDVKADGSDEMLHMGAPGAAPDLIRFGIWHNYRNNFKSRIIQNKTKKYDQYGSLTIDGKYVAESVKKYFSIELKNQSVTESNPPYFYDGKLYHFEGADGEATYFADVKEVSGAGDGTLRMTGELYNADEKEERPATFEATAKPYKFDGADTWAILSFVTEWKEDDGADDLPYWSGFDFGPNLEYAEEYAAESDPGDYKNAAEVTFDTARDNENIPEYSDGTSYTMTLIEIDSIDDKECYVYRLDIDEPTGTLGAGYAYAYESGNIYMQGYGGQYVLIGNAK